MGFKKIIILLIIIGAVAGIGVYQMDVFQIKRKIQGKLAQSELPYLKVKLSDKEFAKIRGQRDSILANPRDYNWFRRPGEKKVVVKAKFIDENGKRKGKMKLAGHYSDHWEKETISYKIKFKKGKFLGSKKFNILIPRSRSYLVDWYATQFQKELGMITLNRELIMVDINEESFLYFFEELFDQNLVERLGINRGFIFNETRDTANVVFVNYEDEEKIPSELKSKFLLQYDSIVDGSKNIEDLFDLDEMAEYYALGDLFQSDHQFVLYNSRYLYIDSTQQLHPIGREFWLPTQLTDKVLFIDKVPGELETGLYGKIPSLLFSSEKFKKIYFEALKNLAEGPVSGIVEEKTKEFREDAKKLFWREVDWGEKLVDVELIKRNQQIILTELKKRGVN